ALDARATRDLAQTSTHFALEPVGREVEGHAAFKGTERFDRNLHIHSCNRGEHRRHVDLLLGQASRDRLRPAAGQRDSLADSARRCQSLPAPPGPRSGRVAARLVRKGALEPPRLPALVPKTRASTNSATFACWHLKHDAAMLCGRPEQTIKRAPGSDPWHPF